MYQSLNTIYKECLAHGWVFTKKSTVIVNPNEIGKRVEGMIVGTIFGGQIIIEDKDGNLSKHQTDRTADWIGNKP